MKSSSLTFFTGVRPTVLLLTLSFAAATSGCDRTGPKPENGSAGSPAQGTTPTGGARNSLNADPNAGKGLSGTRPDDNIPLSPEGRH